MTMRIKLAKQAENKRPHKYKVLITALVLGALVVIIGASFTGVCAISVGGEIIAYGETRSKSIKLLIA